MQRKEMSNFNYKDIVEKKLKEVGIPNQLSVNLERDNCIRVIGNVGGLCSSWYFQLENKTEDDFKQWIDNIIRCAKRDNKQ